MKKFKCKKCKVKFIINEEENEVQPHRCTAQSCPNISIFYMSKKTQLATLLSNARKKKEASNKTLKTLPENYKEKIIRTIPSVECGVMPLKGKCRVERISAA